MLKFGLCPDLQNVVSKVIVHMHRRVEQLKLLSEVGNYLVPLAAIPYFPVLLLKYYYSVALKCVALMSIVMNDEHWDES